MFWKQRVSDNEYTELEMGLRAPLFALPVLPLALLWSWPAWYRAVVIWLLASAAAWAYGWWIRDTEDDESEETGTDDEETDSTDRDIDQRDLVEQLVHVVAPRWSVTFERPDLVCYNELPERLNAVVRHVLTELDGDGGIQPHRLAPQNNPGIDLFDDRKDLCDYPYVGDGEHELDVSDETLFFVAAVQSAQDRVVADTAQTWDDGPRHVVGVLLTKICEIIEEGYVLIPQFYGDDDGELQKEGEDIAPGLTAAFTAEWEAAGNDRE